MEDLSGSFSSEEAFDNLDCATLSSGDVDVINTGDISVFFTRPILLGLLIFMILTIVISLWSSRHQ